MEMMFSTSSYSDIEDMYLFDDHALAIVDDSSTLTVLYFDNFRGEELPQNYGIALISGESVVGHALAILQDGSDVELYIALKLSAAITIEKMKVIVDTKSYNSRVELDSESATVYHLFSAEFTSTRATKDLFILGCETCDSGTIWFYDRQTLELVHEITGSDDKVGVGASGSIAITDNIEKVTHLWYSTSNSDGYLQLHSVYFAKNLETGVWDFREDTNSFQMGTRYPSMATLEITTHENTIIVKDSTSDELYSLQACYLNQYYDEDSGCHACPTETPFSYGIDLPLD